MWGEQWNFTGESGTLKSVVVPTLWSWFEELEKRNGLLNLRFGVKRLIKLSLCRATWNETNSEYMSQIISLCVRRRVDIKPTADTGRIYEAAASRRLSL